MKAYTIYRIEYRDGNGMWKASDKKGDRIYWRLSFLEKMTQKHNKLPTPCEEGFNIVEREYCAFSSINQMNKWINKKWYKELIDKGFKIYRIYVSQCSKLEYQVIFDKKHVIRKVDISKQFQKL